MNLIEQLGGYEQAKVYSVDANACGAFDDENIIKSALLEYRRENNIFEVGDVVVGRCYSDFDDALLTITKKFTHDGKPCIVFECTRTICDDFESEVRHAKPEELGAGHRI